MTTIYDFEVLDIDHKSVKLSQYSGNVILILNVACQCGFTENNYKELVELENKYKSMGLVVLVFPCNQFGGQEPGTNEEITQFVRTKFGATFPIMDKINVNGSDVSPLFEFLKDKQRGILNTTSIKWNFTKFLVDKKGNPIARYSPNQNPLSFEEDIVKALQA